MQGPTQANSPLCPTHINTPVFHYCFHKDPASREGMDAAFTLPMLQHMVRAFSWKVRVRTLSGISRVSVTSSTFGQVVLTIKLVCKRWVATLLPMAF